MSDKEEAKCHFKTMEYCAGDSDDLGDFDEWLECSVCGHVVKIEEGVRHE